jgi:hypothetical protein
VSFERPHLQVETYVSVAHLESLKVLDISIRQHSSCIQHLEKEVMRIKEIDDERGMSGLDEHWSRRIPIDCVMMKANGEMEARMVDMVIYRIVRSVYTQLGRTDVTIPLEICQNSSTLTNCWQLYNHYRCVSHNRSENHRRFSIAASVNVEQG